MKNGLEDHFSSDDSAEIASEVRPKWLKRVTNLEFAQQRPRQLSWIEGGVAELKLLCDRTEAGHRVSPSFQTRRRQPAGRPATKSARCSIPGAVVQRGNVRDIE